MKILWRILAILLFASFLFLVLANLGFSKFLYTAGMPVKKIALGIWGKGVFLWLGLLVTALFAFFRRKTVLILLLLLSPLIVEFFYDIFFLTHGVTGALIFLNRFSALSALLALILALIIIINWVRRRKLT